MSRHAASLSALAFAVASSNISLAALALGSALGAAQAAQIMPPQSESAPQGIETSANASKSDGAALVPADPSFLRICAAASQLPYSSSNGDGFENKIGAIVAKAMGRTPTFVYANKPAIYLVRDWLDKKKCDMIVGLDTGDQRVLTTKPYYRPGYVFVTNKDRHIDIDSWSDPKIKKLGHIVVDFGSPSETMLKELGVYNDDMAYLYSLVGFRAPRNEYVQISPERMIGEVKNGGADMAAGFAPDVARFVKADPNLKMVQIKDDATRNGGEKLPQHYDQSMGVRLGDSALQGDLDAALVKAKPEIDAVLKDEGIPLASSTN